jgi:hypothetical protein
MWITYGDIHNERMTLSETERTTHVSCLDPTGVLYADVEVNLPPSKQTRLILLATQTLRVWEKAMSPL